MCARLYIYVCTCVRAPLTETVREAIGLRISTRVCIGFVQYGMGGERVTLLGITQEQYSRAEGITARPQESFRPSLSLASGMCAAHKRDSLPPASKNLLIPPGATARSPLANSRRTGRRSIGRSARPTFFLLLFRLPFFIAVIVMPRNQFDTRWGCGSRCLGILWLWKRYRWRM